MSTKLIISGFRNIARGIYKFSQTFWSDVLFSTMGRDWDLNWGPHEGKAGDIKHIVAEPQCLFRGQKLLATDNAELRGDGTRITQILIGNRLQLPLGGNGIKSMFFNPGVLGNGMHWDDCQMSEKITLTVKFEKDCIFDATCFGRAVV